MHTAANSAIETEGRYGAHNYEPLPVVLCEGEGGWVRDVRGRRYSMRCRRTRR